MIDDDARDRHRPPPDDMTTPARELQRQGLTVRDIANILRISDTAARALIEQPTRERPT